MVRTEEDQILLSVFSAARITDTKPSTWRKKIQRREIPFVKLGRSVRIPYSYVQGLVKTGWREPVTIEEPAR